MQQTRAMPPLGLLRRRRDSLSSVSSTFSAPTFTATSFSLSWAWVPPQGKRRRHSFAGNARRSPGRRERESLVLQSRSGGPEGKSSVTLRTILKPFTSFSLPCHSSSLRIREFAIKHFALPSFLHCLPAL